MTDELGIPGVGAFANVNENPIEIVKVLDPKIDLDVKREFVVVEGAKTISSYQLNSTSYSNSEIDFVINLTNTTVLNRRLLVEVEFTIDFFEMDTNEPYSYLAHIQGDRESGLRAFPLSSVVNTCTLSVQDNSMKTNLSDTIHAITKYGSETEWRNRYFSTFPSYADQGADYAKAEQNWVNRNPFGNFYNSAYELSRVPENWNYTVDKSDPNNTTYNRLKVTVAEPVFISPLAWGDMNVPGIFNVSEVDLQLSLGNLNRVWCTGSTEYKANVSILTRPKLLIQQLTLQTHQLLPSKPLSYPLETIERFITASVATISSAQTLSGNAPNPFTALSNAQIMNVIPKRIFIYVKRVSSKENTTLNNYPMRFSDTYGSITQVSLSWNNQQNLLSSMDQFQLYQMCMKNGSNQSFSEFSKFQGSVIAIDPSFDIPLNEYESAGYAGGTINLQVEVQFYGLQEGIYNMYVLTVNEGVMTILDSKHVVKSSAVFTHDQMKDARVVHGAQYMKSLDKLSGGGFFDTVKRVVNGISKVVSPIANVVGEVASAIPLPRAQMIGKIANMVDQGANVAKNLTGGRKAKARGGRVMRRSQL